MGVRVANLPAFRRSLARYGQDVDRRLVRAGRLIMAGIERAAKRRAPVDTGQLRASITWTIRMSRGRVVGLIGSAVRHAKYTEFREKVGATTRYVPGGGNVARPITSWPALSKRGGRSQTMPWLRPAVVEIVRKQAVAQIKRAVRQASGR
jgi:hypothetical protein